MADEFATIAERYKGPPQSGNGGYSCGILGTLIGDCAEVTLQAPPPLEKDLAIKQDGDDWTLLDDDQVIATGKPADLTLDVPSPPGYGEAGEAEAHYSGFEWHVFPECFVCGPDRHEHDGLRIFPGKLDGRDVVASHWLPGQDVAGEFGAVRGRVVWAALDCPTYFGGQLNPENSKLAVLGRLTARLIAPVEVDKPHVVIGWPVGTGERTWHGGSAIYDADGQLKAYALGTWVVIPEDHAGFKPSET